MISRLKVAIDRSGLKQTYIAQQTGVPYEYISKYVRGVLRPPPDKLKAMARLLKCKPADLLEAE